MRKVLCLTVIVLLAAGVGIGYGDVPRQRDSILPGEDFPRFLAPSEIKVAQAGFKFMDYPIGARPAAMAGAFSTVTGDAHSLFWNPAGLAFIKSRGGEAFGGHTKWIGGATYDYGGLAYNVNGVNAFGFGLMTVNNGEFQGTKVNPNAALGYDLTSMFKVKEFMVSVAYARKITDRFSVGGAFKVASQDLGNGNILDVFNKPAVISNKSKSWAVDLGTYFNTGFRSLAIGVNVNNFARTQDYQGETFEMPRRVAMAFSGDLFTLANKSKDNHKAFFHFDVEKPQDFNERPLVGGEYIYTSPRGQVALALRSGYRFNHDTESYSLGGGLKFKTSAGRGVSVDYAYKRFDADFFNAVHMVSGSVLF